MHFKRALRRKLVELELSESVDKNILVQNWFRKLWAVQLVPPLDAAWVWDNHIKTSVPYEEDEEAIAEDPERVDQFTKRFPRKMLA